MCVGRVGAFALVLVCFDLKAHTFGGQLDIQHVRCVLSSAWSRAVLLNRSKISPMQPAVTTVLSIESYRPNTFQKSAPVDRHLVPLSWRLSRSPQIVQRSAGLPTGVAEGYRYRRHAKTSLSVFFDETKATNKNEVHRNPHQANHKKTRARMCLSVFCFRNLWKFERRPRNLVVSELVCCC